MEKIEFFVFYRLSNSAHQVFMTSIRELVEQLTPAKLNIEEVFAKFCEALEGVDKAIRGNRGSSITHELLQLDRQRLKTWSAISGRLKNTLACPFEAEKEAAKALLWAARKARKVRTMEYIDKSVTLRIVCNKLLDTEHAPLCSQLNLKHWVEALRDENLYFQDKRHERTRENAYKDAGTVADARKRLDTAYSNIISRINASVDLGLTNEKMLDFILQTNLQIKKLKALQAWRKSMRAGKKKRDAEKDKQ